MNKKYLSILGLLAAAAIVGYLAVRDSAPPYDPALSVEDFVVGIDNKYFTLKPGTKFTYEARTPEGLERIEVVVTNQTKLVQGVTTTVVRDTVKLDGVLIEDTYDWYAQDKAGNVWYFGETVDNYENGVVANHDGSWEAGVDGAKPGIAMPAEPKVGDEYRQEYYKGQAEDMGTVIALNETVTVPLGTYSGCLKTYDWSRIDSALQEHKYYCPDVGFFTLEVAGDERVELVKVAK